ncbi:hypothetical protein BU23DRAFT_568878 [Bimuria novae-zelandiae CBS 107.79]|uniref:2,6-dihydroxypyridine 3-monooxygenase substrate binding domain-containing protein n=1 Tax=Bimuria novae-zelandiae CBS 107.79 TaxID=1447943 RepID=A0A6A5VCC6_9PLEO|nr:hypothetical protein BU23DRAFT_568878 [Bimuria novae-zelandiae CBS 107.79]
MATREGHDAGVSIGPAIRSFLTKHDRVRREFTLTCTPPVKISQEGKSELNENQTMVMTNWGLLVKVLRANFDGTTSKVIPTAPGPEAGDDIVEYKSGARVTDLKDVGDRVEVQYEDIHSHAMETISAHLVVVADGSTSSMRRLLMPDVDHNSHRTAFVILSSLSYTVPTEDGDSGVDKRLYNWIWYNNLPEDSPDMERLFTDVDGKLHRGTVPRRLVRPENWEKQKAVAFSVLPQGLAEVVTKTAQPFIAKMYDVTSPKGLFFDGKVFLVGDALMTIRPNVGMSTQSAAHDCNMLEQVIEGAISPRQWEKAVLRYRHRQRRFALFVSAFGLRSIFFAVGEGLR